MHKKKKHTELLFFKCFQRHEDDLIRKTLSPLERVRIRSRAVVDAASSRAVLAEVVETDSRLSLADPCTMVLQVPV